MPKPILIFAYFISFTVGYLFGDFAYYCFNGKSVHDNLWNTVFSTETK